eukprot:COSAG06_NODE_7784_length_2377_cov_17.482880_2_plen_184_part_00
MEVSWLPTTLAYKLIRRGCSLADLATLAMLWPRGGHVPQQTKDGQAISCTALGCGHHHLQPQPRALLDRRQQLRATQLRERGLHEAPRHAGEPPELPQAEEVAEDNSSGQQLVCCAGLSVLGWGRRWWAPVGGSYIVLKLKICVLTWPQWLRSHSYSRTWLERSPSTVKFTLSGFHSVTAASP